MKYAVVTGGTRGIGKRICLDMLIKGYFVFTNYSNDELSASNASSEFAKYSKNFSIIKADQSNELELNSFITKIKSITKNIDCIVCNTGITLKKNFSLTGNDEWEKVFKVNVHSHFYIIRDLDLLIQPNSKIIFVGSVLGELPHATSLAYGVTKAAVHALAKNLVKEFSDRQITVNTIAPGFVETDWQKDKPIEIRNNIYKKTVARRFAKVEEISKVCMLIIENDFVNGSTFIVDGGYNYK
jgi:3-oxoacyl-[acyl-carrier protein] reductase